MSDERTTQPIHPPNAEKAQEWVTALSAAAIQHELLRAEDGWLIRPGPGADEGARTEIAEYEAVNRDWPPREQAPPPPAPAQVSPAADLLACSLLIVFYAWLGPFHADSALHRAGAADAGRIVAGEWWRSLTALTLHAGPRHLLSNVLGLWLFAHAISCAYGLGVSWGLVLYSAAAANVLLAHIPASRHVGIGASTAVFAAVGILAAHGVVQRVRILPRHAIRWSKAWLPVGGGLALLALFGADPRSDLAAHGFGFVTGMLFGVVPALYLRRPPSEWTQRALQLVTLCAVLLAWVAVFRTVA